MKRTSTQWLDVFKQRGALWIHDDNPNRPHVKLRSGKHSNGYFESKLLITNADLMDEATSDLIRLFMEQDGELHDIEGVVGPQTGATKLAELLSEDIESRTGSECFWASPAKKLENDKKSMAFDDFEKGIVRGRYALLCEDVITTGGSIDLTVDAVHDCGGAVMSYVLALVNRSGQDMIDGRKIISLVDPFMPIWPPEECKLCKVKSEAIEINGPDDWARLNAQY